MQPIIVLSYDRSEIIDWEYLGGFSRISWISSSSYLGKDIFLFWTKKVRNSHFWGPSAGTKSLMVHVIDHLQLD